MRVQYAVLDAEAFTNHQADGVLTRGQTRSRASYVSLNVASTRSRRPITLRFCRSTLCPRQEANLHLSILAASRWRLRLAW